MALAEASGVRPAGRSSLPRPDLETGRRVWQLQSRVLWEGVLSADKDNLSTVQGRPGFIYPQVNVMALNPPFCLNYWNTDVSSVSLFFLREVSAERVRCASR